MTEPKVTSPAATYEAFQVRYLFGPWGLDLVTADPLLRGRARYGQRAPSYQPRTRSALRVFQRLGRPSPSSSVKWTRPG